MRDFGLVVLAIFLLWLWDPSWPGKALGEAVSAYRAAVTSEACLPGAALQKEDERHG